ncbi:MAG: hypothetical protein ACHQ1D_00905 [Nitrososphaerales archaeon]
MQQTTRATKKSLRAWSSTSVPFSIILLSLIFFITFISSVSAQSSADQYLGKFKQGSCVDLKMTCSNCNFVNITQAIYPNSTQALGQVSMTKAGTIYNYSFCNTQTLGKYIYWVIGDLDGELTSVGVGFDIASGDVYLILVLVGLGLIILIFAFLMENEWLGFIAGVLFIVAGVYVLIYGLLTLSDLYTRAIAWTLIGLGFLFEIAAGYKVVEENRGFRMNE